MVPFCRIVVFKKESRLFENHTILCFVEIITADNVAFC
jgi:hypothetical protein